MVFHNFFEIYSDTYWEVNDALLDEWDIGQSVSDGAD